MLAAASDVPEARAVVTIGAPSDPIHVKGLFADRLEEIGAKGEVEVVLGGRPFRISRTFVDDLAGHRLLDRLGDLHKALLIFHSPTDVTVGIENAGRIFTAAKHPKSFPSSLAGADHLLSRRSDAIYVANVIHAWAERYLDMAEAAPTCRTTPRPSLFAKRGAAAFNSKSRWDAIASWPMSRPMSAASTAVRALTISCLPAWALARR